MMDTSRTATAFLTKETEMAIIVFLFLLELKVDVMAAATVATL